MTRFQCTYVINLIQKIKQILHSYQKSPFTLRITYTFQNSNYENELNVKSS